MHSSLSPPNRLAQVAAKLRGADLLYPALVAILVECFAAFPAPSGRLRTVPASTQPSSTGLPAIIQASTSSSCRTSAIAARTRLSQSQSRMVR